MENTNSNLLMKSDESMVFVRYHQISSDFISTVFACYHMPMGKNNELKIKQSQKKNPKPNCIEAILIKAPSVQPFCFCSNGEANEGYEKGNEINLCKKGKPTPGKGKQTLAKGKNTSAKGKPTSAKGKPLKNDAVQKGA